jgi:hypothetical protein
MAPRIVLAKRKIPLWGQRHGCKDSNIKLDLTKIVSGCEMNLNVRQKASGNTQRNWVL